MIKTTIWDALSEKLGRAPTGAECRDECQRIIREAVTGEGWGRMSDSDRSRFRRY